MVFFMVFAKNRAFLAQIGDFPLQGVKVLRRGAQLLPRGVRPVRYGVQLL
jgi:hypothetical protein